MVAKLEIRARGRLLDAPPIFLTIRRQLPSNGISCYATVSCGKRILTELYKRYPGSWRSEYLRGECERNDKNYTIRIAISSCVKRCRAFEQRTHQWILKRHQTLANHYDIKFWESWRIRYLSWEFKLKNRPSVSQSTARGSIWAIDRLSAIFLSWGILCARWPTTVRLPQLYQHIDRSLH